MISAVVLTKDEEGNIEECLKSLSFCEEIVVVDDYSSDKTVEKCQMSKVKCQIYRRRLNGDFAAQRNFALKKAKHKWVLFIDADERVTPELRSEIIQLINNPMIRYSGYYLKRKDYMWGRELRYGETGTAGLLRLAEKKAGSWKRKIHEYWDIERPTYNLKNPLLHYPHPKLSDFIESINWMSSLHAEANLDEGKHSSVIKILFWPLGKFINNYLKKLGFLDGVQGFIIALMMSFHSFLAWSKLWLTQKKNNDAIV